MKRYAVRGALATAYGLLPNCNFDAALRDLTIMEDRLDMYERLQGDMSDADFVAFVQEAFKCEALA